MIVPMSKYDFVLYHGQKDDFLNKLQDLGLVDITTTAWEPNDRERELMASIDKHRAAVERLKAFAAEEGFEQGKAYATPDEAWEQYLSVMERYDSLSAQIAAAEKDALDMQVWGDFDPQHLAELEKGGVELHFFSSYTKEFESSVAEWQQQYNLARISDVGGTTYFVVITTPGEEVMLNAQELRRPEATHKQKTVEVEKLYGERNAMLAELGRAVASVDLIEEHGNAEQERLQFSQVVNTARDEAEGTLILMEGWAPKENADKVDEFVNGYPNLFYIKSNPTPEDETPTLLKNNKFNSMFEFIGNFYSLPKYGSMDLTSFFGPFYVLFFGLCLADAGYGLLWLLGGIFLTKKLTGNLKGIPRLVMLCGLSTMVCGLFMGSFFGIPLGEVEAFGKFRDYMLSTDNLFYLALGIGVVQILFAMSLKVIMYTKQYGFKYALSTIGWMIILISTLAAVVTPMAGIDSFGMSSVPYLVCAGIGAVLMLFFNSPGKNILMNFGAGLWEGYNNIVGFISDFLSYIRLFAIGLSGGILALVFNQLAFGLTEGLPMVGRILGAVIILLIGHSINLFMSSLSSFVHPMRLTFVEFYNNAGFETTMRAFTPFKRNKNNK